MPDLAASRAQPSLQLIGSEPPRDLDLFTLTARGVRVCGRVADASGSRLWFADDLAQHVRAADGKLSRLLARIDCAIESSAAPEPFAKGPRPAPIALGALPAVRSLDLGAERIGNVLWATGFVRDYGFLQVPVLDARGEIVHARGVTAAPGLYAMGLRFQHTRKSSFIDGVAADAEYVALQACSTGSPALRCVW